MNEAEERLRIHNAEADVEAAAQLVYDAAYDRVEDLLTGNEVEMFRDWLNIVLDDPRQRKHIGNVLGHILRKYRFLRVNVIDGLVGTDWSE